jgi:hypothetical protein
VVASSQSIFVVEHPEKAATTAMNNNTLSADKEIYPHLAEITAD